MLETVSGLYVNDVYIDASRKLNSNSIEQNSRNGKTKELHPFIIEIDDFKHYFLTVKGRVINFPMALAEIAWIMSGSDTPWIIHYNKQLENYADDTPDGKVFNAAYGHRMRIAFQEDQFLDVLNHLLKDPDSRHAAIVYRHPRYDASIQPTKDRACNISSLFLIRDGKLDITQTVRSHDFIWGVPYNFIQFGYIAQAIAEKLHILVGRAIFVSNSMHVYEQYWDELTNIRTNVLFEPSYETIPKIGIVSVSDKGYNSIVELFHFIENNYKSLRVHEIKEMSASPFWSDALLIIYAYWQRRNIDIVLETLDCCQSDLFKALMLRYLCTYWTLWQGVLSEIDQAGNLLLRNTINTWGWDYNIFKEWV